MMMVDNGIYIYICIHHWLVVCFYPFWQIWLRQLGWWIIPNWIWENNPVMFQITNQFWTLCLGLEKSELQKHLKKWCQFQGRPTNEQQLAIFSQLYTLTIGRLWIHKVAIKCKVNIGDWYIWYFKSIYLCINKVKQIWIHALLSSRHVLLFDGGVATRPSIEASMKSASPSDGLKNQCQ